jgi:hypothetical protein
VAFELESSWQSHTLGYHSAPTASSIPERKPKEP